MKADIIAFTGNQYDGATTVEIDFRVSRIFQQGLIVRGPRPAAPFCRSSLAPVELPLARTHERVGRCLAPQRAPARPGEGPAGQGPGSERKGNGRKREKTARRTRERKENRAVKGFGGCASNRRAGPFIVSNSRLPFERPPLSLLDPR